MYECTCIHAKKKKMYMQNILFKAQERERKRDRERSHDHHVDGGNMNNINGKQRESHVT